MISKELLSEVLNDNKIIGCSFTSEIGFDAIEYAWVGCRAIDDCEEFIEHINVYELAHKCKMWAYTLNVGIVDKYNYYIWSGIDHNGKWGVFATEFKSFCNFTPCVEQNILPFIYEDTEPEAIFKACQWILDNKGKQ